MTAADRMGEAFGAAAKPLAPRVAATLAMLICANLGLWLAAFLAFHADPFLLGVAFLAYSFGLRHAVDADHIAAIDNVTRKLMQAGRRPLGVGLWFSLGHSTIVFALTAAIAASAVSVKTRFPALEAVGGVAGTLVSASFLIAIAIMNLIVLKSILGAFARVKAGGAYREQDVDMLLAGRGLMARLFRGLFRLVERSWHMYFVGFLFGLGFDTATEVGLLSVSATEAVKGLSVWSILLFPALFAAAMALVDSADCAIMIGAYGWAFAKPLRRLYYNITVTSMSALVALLIGALETLGLIQSSLGLEGGFWTLVERLNRDFGAIGYLVIALFVLCWLASVAFYKWRGYDRMDVTLAE